MTKAVAHEVPSIETLQALIRGELSRDIENVQEKRGVAPVNRILGGWDDNSRALALKVAQNYLYQGRYPDSIAIHVTVLMAYPQDSLALLGLGVALMRTDHFETALEAVDAAIKWGGSSDAALVSRAEALMYLGRAPEALKALDELLESDPEGRQQNTKRAKDLRSLVEVIVANNEKAVPSDESKKFTPKTSSKKGASHGVGVAKSKSSKK